MTTDQELKKLIKEALREEKGQHEHTPSRAEVVEGNANIICEDGECYSAVIKKAKKFKYQCEDCDLPLPDAMVSARSYEPNPIPCPNCGSMNAKEREEDEE